MRTLIAVGVAAAVAGTAVVSLAACASPSTQRGEATGLTVIDGSADTGSTDTGPPSGSPQASTDATTSGQSVGGGAGTSSAVGAVTSRARGSATLSASSAGRGTSSTAGSSGVTTSTSGQTTPGQSTTTGATATSPPLPSVVSFKVQIQPTCSAGGVAGTAARLAWQVANATEADLSADAPAGVIGTLKKGLPTSGWLDVRFTCSGAPGSTETHVFDLYAVSGSNHAVSEISVSTKIPATSTPTTTVSPPTSTPSSGL